MKAKVATGEHPWIDGWNLLITDRKAQTDYRPAPKANMGVSRQRAQDDATAAYLNAMRWYISGDATYADCAVRNLNSWSAAVNQVPSGTDQPGLGGIPIGTFALAAEVLRIYPGWAEADQARFKAMLLNYFYPACNDFLTRHNGGGVSRYWANWDTANVLSLVAIGVFCDDRAKFDQGVAYFKDGEGTGSIKNAVYFLHPGNLGQWQESGRDHAHALGGMGLLAETCQVAGNQGIDLFSYSNNRLLAGAEYEAQYTLWKGVPYKYYNNSDNAKQYYISTNYHGRLDNCQFYELLYNHYVIRKGIVAPNVKRFAEVIRPERGNADILGYGTLTYTLDATASPYPPSPVPPVPLDVTAAAGIGRIELKWSPSGAYSAQGYNVSRAAAPGGPYTSIFSTTGNTSPQFTDTKVTNGTTYYYVVAALNQSGASDNSAPASATPAAAGDLPEGWAHTDIGTPTVSGSASYAAANNNSFVVSGEGSGIGGTADHCHYVCKTVTGDFTITARMIDVNGLTDKAGLMMRESTAANSIALAMTKGERGGRQARFKTRHMTGEAMDAQPGNDYTWTPVWFRLQRQGNTFTASQSPDGSTWFVVGTRIVAMPPTYFVGLATSSGSTKGELSTVSFDNVMTDVAPPPPPAAPKQLTATASGNAITLNWTNTARNQDGFKIECSSDNILFYEIADLGAGASSFVNTGLAASTYYYRVTACNSGGRSTCSNTASATSR
jgi:regulation of enolase protein 1 (concanavalin A-like superfamily)